MSTLLEKTRKLNKILQKSAIDIVVFEDICNILSKVLECNVYLVERKGIILGYSCSEKFECDVMRQTITYNKRFPQSYNKRLLAVKSTLANSENNGECVFEEQGNCHMKNKISTIVPILGNGERLGTLLLARFGENFTDDDLVLSEYSATVVGMEILRSKRLELEEEARKKAVVQLAIGTLSYSELEAIEHIFDELDGKEGLLVASKIADKVGITRSVIVNALRKLESAGVIESRSLGMKGTYIKVLNEKLLTELNKIK
ncbi:MAG: GTP-sensing pleiotropic transcriptional regulator CodY [Sarcina sp.]